MLTLRDLVIPPPRRKTELLPSLTFYNGKTVCQGGRIQVGIKLGQIPVAVPGSVMEKEESELRGRDDSQKFLTWLCT